MFAPLIIAFAGLVFLCLGAVELLLLGTPNAAYWSFLIAIALCVVALLVHFPRTK